MSTATTTPLPPADTAYIEGVAAHRTAAFRAEVAELREDNAHLLRTAREATAGLADARHHQQVLTARMGAILHYLATADVTDEIRRDVRALAHGQQ